MAREPSLPFQVMDKRPPPLDKQALENGRQEPWPAISAPGLSVFEKALAGAERGIRREARATFHFALILEAPRPAVWVLRRAGDLATTCWAARHDHWNQRSGLPAGFIAPCLRTKSDRLPSGSQWLHEIKHDGFRIIARKIGRQAVRGRKGHFQLFP